MAWKGLGYSPVAFSEIAPFQSALLAHHYPEVPNLGDLNGHSAWSIRQPDLIIGGTPCQSFSAAGKRGGLEDARGQLMYAFLELVASARPRVVVWENVPGVLSSCQGRDFGAFVGSLGNLGYGWAYRVLDAQWFGVPQRRRRVFVVGCSGADVSRAGAVLFESESVRGDSAPRREARTDDSGSTGDGIARCLRGEGSLNKGVENSNYVAEVARCLLTTGMKSGDWETGNYVAASIRVRRLTATECERLQGFPDGYTAITYRGKPAADSPRIAALGNSMAVPVVRWLGERIQRFVFGG